MGVSETVLSTTQARAPLSPRLFLLTSWYSPARVRNMSATLGAPSASSHVSRPAEAWWWWLLAPLLAAAWCEAAPSARAASADDA
jgi:hypothetical protein